MEMREHRAPRWKDANRNCGQFRGNIMLEQLVERTLPILLPGLQRVGGCKVRGPVLPGKFVFESWPWG